MSDLVSKTTICPIPDGHRYDANGHCEWCDAERQWPPLKQPFTDNMIAAILRDMTDEELEAAIQRGKTT